MLRRIYAGATVAAAMCVVAILVLVCIEILGRLLNQALLSLGLETVNATVPSLAEICGYLLAGATFLALADTMAKGVHIRVSLLLDSVDGARRRCCEVTACLVALGVAIACAWGMGRLVLKSWRFGDVSVGTVPVPLALPQAVMFLGVCLLCLSLLERTVILVRGCRAKARDGQALVGE